MQEWPWDYTGLFLQMRISLKKYLTSELHILKRLCELLTRNRVYDITDTEQVEPRITYVLPREMNKTWFC